MSRWIDGVVKNIGKDSSVLKLENGLKIKTTLLNGSKAKVGQRVKVTYNFTNNTIRSVQLLWPSNCMGGFTVTELRTSILSGRGGTQQK